MKKIVGWSVLLYLSSTLCLFSQVDTSYIYNTNTPYGTLDLRIAKSATRYYYLQEDKTFSFRKDPSGVNTNTYTTMVTWDSKAYGQGNLREVNGVADNFVMNYRLLKPQNYNASYSPGYPIIIMLHGGGEAANCWIDARCHWATDAYNPVTNSPPAPTDIDHKLLNNDRNLLHGGSIHLTSVNLAGSKLPNDPTLAARAFPGFVLFPQSLNGWGPHVKVEDAIRILRLIIKKYNIDESRVYIHGLSNGGGGVYQALKRAPWLFAAALPMSAVNDGGIVNSNMVPEVSKLPLWVFQGGLDNNPTPGRTYNTVRKFRDAGGVVRYSFYPNLGHGTWNTAYKEPDFFSWILSKKKYNPRIAYGQPIICNTTQTGVQLAFSKGYFAYQWQRDGLLMAAETGAEMMANTPGTYRGRFSRKANPSEADWERWSDPVVVSEINPAKTSIAVLGTAHLRGPGLLSTEANNTVKLLASDSAELYFWYKNGEPVNFSGTDVEDTLSVASFTSASTGGNGVYTLVTKNANCPGPPSDPVNLFFSGSSPQNIVINSTELNFQGAPTSSSIFLTWNDVSSHETGYEIWRRRAGSPDFAFVTKTKEDAISYHDIHLDPGTSYEYKLRAVSHTSRSNYSPSDDPAVNYLFMTSDDFHYPPPPQALAVVSNTLNTISFKWKAAKDESSIKEYFIYYRGDSISTGSRATSYTLTGLVQNSVYRVTVKAVDFGNHFSQASNQVLATTFLSGLTYKHSTGAWEDLDDSAMVATWIYPEFTGLVDNFTLQPRTQDDYFNFQYIGYLDILTEGTYFFQVNSSDGSRLILDDSVLVDNDGIHGSKTLSSGGVYLTVGPHPIEVQYFDDVGGHSLNVRYKGPGIGDIFVAIPNSALRSGTYIPATPPVPPVAVAATGVSMERIDISWQFEDDELTGYEVYRATDISAPFIIVASVKGTVAADTIGLIPGTVYYYKVKTVNSNGSSSFSVVTTATTLTYSEPPTIPLELAIIGKTISNLTFSWKPSTDNVAVTGYEIYSSNELIGTSTIHAFTVEDLSPNTQYMLTVKAVDVSGNRSGASSALAIMTTNSATFHSSAAGNLSDLSTWHRNANGTGESPANFSANGQYFIVSNRTSTSMGGALTIGGTASRVIVPTGVTLTVDQPFSARIELQGNAIVNLDHASAPELIKLSPASTVKFNAYPIIHANTYGNVILSGVVAKTFSADTITVLGNLIVNNGISLKGSPHNTSHIRLGGSMTLLGTRPETSADNGIDLAFNGAGTQSIITDSDLYLYRILTAENKFVNVSVPPGSPIKINLGSLNGGGLILAPGSVLHMGQNNLALQGEAVINPDQQTGKIDMQGGDLTISSASSRNSYLYLDAVNYSVNYLEIDLTGTGNLSVNNPLQISTGIKIKNGTLASQGNVTLLSTSEKTAAIFEIENGGMISGEVTVQQFLEPRGMMYRYLSTPVSGVTVAKWQASFPITGQFSGASTGVGLTNQPSLFVYRSTGWAAYPPAGGTNASPIERGTGYSALLRNSTEPIVLQVKGIPFQGSIPFVLAGGSGGLANSGWNLVGNPYASSVVWNNDAEAWTRSGVNNVVAVRSNKMVNGIARSQVKYYDLLLGGGTIGAGEAFWVQAADATPTLVINEKAKLNTDGQNETPVVVNHLIVNLKQGDVSDPAYILFTELGTDGYDAKYDGRKMKNYGMFNFSTLANDTVALAVNNLTSTFCTKTVTLKVGDVLPGSYALSFEHLEFISDIGSIVLVDHYTGSNTVINGSDYVFSVTAEANSYGPSRFALTFTKKQLDLTTPKIEAKDICPPGYGVVSIGDSQTGVDYYVINAQGKIISALAEGNGETITLDILPGELVLGPNTIRISAGFTGCERQMLPGEAILNYSAEISVLTQEDISVCVGADVTLVASGAPAGGFYKWFDSEGVLIEGATSSTLAVSEVFTEAVYYVAAAHPDGCESELQPIHIYADTLDMPEVRMDKDTLYTDVAGYYQWKKDGEPITGATLHYYKPTESGSYTVVASNGGCFKESDPFNLNAGGDGDGDGDGGGDGDPVTSIENGYNHEFMMNIYPVPSDGRSLNIEVRSPKSEAVLIEVIDILGRLYYSGQFDTNTLANGIKITPHTPLYNGIYFIRATQANIKARKKILVKN
ncbi:MAG: fibronectin type III domain-containing protein [Cyclobacteriaceae bacterium]